MKPRTYSVAPSWLLFKDGMVVGILHAFCKFTVARYLREQELDRAEGMLYSAVKGSEVLHKVYPVF